jgi:hypothetical protein
MKGASSCKPSARAVAPATRRILLLAMLLGACIDVCAQSKLVLAANGSHIFDTPTAPALLKQCSRDSPASVSGYWVPAQAQISAFERALMRKDGQLMMAQKNVPQKSYDRQYIGLIIAKKKVIYGNFFPSSAVAEMAGLTTAVVACDGGAQFWGATYDPQTDKMISIDVNGSY